MPRRVRNCNECHRRFIAATLTIAVCHSCSERKLGNIEVSTLMSTVENKETELERANKVVSSTPLSLPQSSVTSSPCISSSLFETNIARSDACIDTKHFLSSFTSEEAAQDQYVLTTETDVVENRTNPCDDPSLSVNPQISIVTEEENYNDVYCNDGTGSEGGDDVNCTQIIEIDDDDDGDNDSDNNYNDIEYTDVRKRENFRDNVEGFDVGAIDEQLLIDMVKKQQSRNGLDGPSVIDQCMTGLITDVTRKETCFDVVEEIEDDDDDDDAIVIQTKGDGTNDFMTCFVCGASLIHLQTGYKGRISHVKRCSKKNGVMARHVRYNDEYEVFEQQEQQRKAMNVDYVAKCSNSIVNPYSPKKNWHGNATIDLKLTATSAETDDKKRSAFNVLMAGARRAAKTKKVKPLAATVAASGLAAFTPRKRRRWGNQRNNYNNQRNTPCPAFKKIPGTDFVCDGFHYAQKSLTKSYFLSHFHADHYGGITKYWDAGIIYCSLPTANLVNEQLGVDRKWLHPLPMNTPYVIESMGKSVSVTLLDANHCPGAVMFLFLVGKRHILHVGDFRWNHELMQTYPPLKPYLSGCVRLDDLMLDTTYCNEKYSFSSQKETIEAAVEVAVKEHSFSKRQNQQVLMLFGAYTIGKERIYLSVAEKLGLKVYVDSRRYRILKALQWPASKLAMLTTKPSETCLWVVPLGHINMKSLSNYLTVKNGGKSRTFDRVIGFRPTGWSHSPKSATAGSGIVKTQSRNNLTVHSIPYSEHSSFAELVDCVRRLKPLRIIPTVSVSKSQQQVDLLLKHAQLNNICK